MSLGLSLAAPGPVALEVGEVGSPLHVTDVALNVGSRASFLDPVLAEADILAPGAGSLELGEVREMIIQNKLLLP